MPCAQALKHQQTFLLLFSKPESQVFSIVACTEIGAEFLFCRDQLFNPLQIRIAQSAQTVGNLFRPGHLRPNEPEGIDEGPKGKIAPLLPEIPKLEFTRLLSKLDRLIANQESRAARA